MIVKNCEGAIPTPGAFTEDDTAMLASADGLLAICREEFSKQAIQKAVAAIIAVVSEATAILRGRSPGR